MNCANALQLTPSNKLEGFILEELMTLGTKFVQIVFAGQVTHASRIICQCPRWQVVMATATVAFPTPEELYIQVCVFSTGAVHSVLEDSAVRSLLLLREA